MRLPFKRPKPDAEAAPPRARPAPGAGDSAAVLAARTQARRRLVGALVLLVIGVLGFPVLFETQPRPLPVDTPIELPRREAAAEAPKPVAAPRPLPVPVVPADAGDEQPSAPVASATVAPPTPAIASAPSAPAVASAPRAPAVAAAPPALASTQAADEGRAVLSQPLVAASASATAPRFVVQAGAYSEATKLREARARIEALGLKTYTQVVDSESGKRTRVRVGPFTSREEADAAAAKIKRGGLPVAVLTL